MAAAAVSASAVAAAVATAATAAAAATVAVVAAAGTVADSARSRIELRRAASVIFEMDIAGKRSAERAGNPMVLSVRCSAVSVPPARRWKVEDDSAAFCDAWPLDSSPPLSLFDSLPSTKLSTLRSSVSAGHDRSAASFGAQEGPRAARAECTGIGACDAYSA